MILRNQLVQILCGSERSDSPISNRCCQLTIPLLYRIAGRKHSGNICLIRQEDLALTTLHPSQIQEAQCSINMPTYYAVRSMKRNTGSSYGRKIGATVDERNSERHRQKLHPNPHRVSRCQFLYVHAIDIAKQHFSKSKKRFTLLHILIALGKISRDPFLVAGP